MAGTKPATIDGNEFTTSLMSFEPQRAPLVPYNERGGELWHGRRRGAMRPGRAPRPGALPVRDDEMYKHLNNSIKDFCTRMYAPHSITIVVAIH